MVAGDFWQFAKARLNSGCGQNVELGLLGNKAHQVPFRKGRKIMEAVVTFVRNIGIDGASGGLKVGGYLSYPVTAPIRA